MARSAEKVYGDKPLSIVDKPLDQLIRKLNSNQVPEEVQIIIGYYKKKNKKFIEDKGFYNVRYGANYPLNGKLVTAQYLVLYSDKSFNHNYIYPIKPNSGSLWSKDKIIENGYKDPSQEMYFVFELGEKIELGPHIFNTEHKLIKSKIAEAKRLHIPFTLNLIELSKIRKAKN